MAKAKTTKTTPKKKTTNYSGTYRNAGTALEVIQAARGKGGPQAVIRALSAGTEGKPKLKKSNAKPKTPKAGPGKKRVQGSGKTRGFSSTGGGGGEWATIKGRRIPLGKG